MQNVPIAEEYRTTSKPCIDKAASEETVEFRRANLVTAAHQCAASA